jgi:hypothetical protein
VTSLINGKLALKFASSELEAMRAIANAHAKHSLKEFKMVIEKYKKGFHFPLPFQNLKLLLVIVLDAKENLFF